MTLVITSHGRELLLESRDDMLTVKLSTGSKHIGIRLTPEEEKQLREFLIARAN